MNPIALDAGGGDNMPHAAIEGAINASQQGIPVLLVGDKTKLEPELAKHGTNLDIHHCEDVISMEDDASNVRRRRDSSIMQGMTLVKEGKASGCVSMGHSGATMASALMVLGRIKGVERPAILANIPYRGGYTALIDAGANADCKATYLQQFAIMGSVYAEEFYGASSPKVGLMSIGEEDHKGNELTRDAHQLLKDTTGINFFGNVEGRDLLSGIVDVIVTDGFTGNVMLKQAEGEARDIFNWIRAEVKAANPLVKIGALLVRPAFRALAKAMDPATYGAQPLLGVKGYAFIGHGSADARAVTNALKTAKRSIDADLLVKITEGVSHLQQEAELVSA